MPEGLSAGLPGTTAATDVGSAAAGAAGMAPEAGGTFFQSVLYNVFNNWPGLAQMTGFNAVRMSNSIMYGGFKPSNTPLGTVRGGLRNHMHPRALFRMYDADPLISPVPRRDASGRILTNARGTTRMGYSPYNVGGFVNNFVNSGQEARAAGKAGAVRGGALSALEGRGLLGPGAQVMEGGVFAKSLTGMKLARMETVGARGLGARWMTKGASGGVVAKYTGQAGTTAAAHYMANAFTSTTGAKFGGRVAGLRLGSQAAQAGAMRGAAAVMGGDMAGAAAAHAFTQSAGKVGTTLAGGGLKIAEGKMVTMAGGKVGPRAIMAGTRQVAQQTGSKIAAGKFAGTVATRVGIAALDGPLPILDAAMIAWTAFDVAKMGMGIFRDRAEKARQKAKEAAKSFKGQIEKPVMGMGFVDNEVAATARSRGVMAIQNSRLNARSVLGAEAGPLHAHFG